MKSLRQILIVIVSFSRFELDLANNLEVEFLVYSWDPQLRHRLCYRSSLRLAALFGKGQTFQQVALRMHPAGTLYLTLRFTDMREAYDRSSRMANPPNSGIPGISPVVPQIGSLVPRVGVAPGAHAHGAGGAVRGVGVAVGADLLLLPPLGTAVLEPNLRNK